MSLFREHARPRLEYLDGVRAVAALYVSLFHATLTATWANPYAPPQDLALPGWFAWVQPSLLLGHFGVSIFIILSGYCLMLPVARRTDGRLPGGTLAFLGRRARRLLPPYYAALALSLLLSEVPGFGQLNGTRWDESHPVWDPGVLWSHLLLVHNWRWEWFLRIDMPVWSVATEWQIYWLFALLMLPLARRVGVVATAVLALAAGFGALFLKGYHEFIFYSYPGLFALGMAGAVVNFSEVPWAVRARDRLPWGWLSALGWGGFVALLFWPGRGWALQHLWFVDPLAGAGTLCLLVYCTRALGGERHAPLPWLVRVFQTGWLVRIGGFSYSYYLIHDPVFAVLHFELASLGLSFAHTAYLMLVLAIPFALAFAYLFHLVFERPFMPGHPRTLDRAAHAAVLSPAP